MMTFYIADTDILDEALNLKNELYMHRYTEVLFMHQNCLKRIVT